jgi:hypothetical protein
MAVKELRDAYLSSLNAAFASSGVPRVAKAIFAETTDDVIWRGIYISSHGKWGILQSQPSLGVFCPSAERIVSDCLFHLSPNYKRTPFFGKLGLPVLSHPLYDLVFREYDKDRRPYSYDVSAPDQIEGKAKLVRDDFLQARDMLLDPGASLEQLENRLLHDWAPGARMYAIAVGYLRNPHIRVDEINRLLGSAPNAMCQEFADYFKANRVLRQ